MYQSPEVIPHNGLARVLQSLQPEVLIRASDADRRACKLRRLIDANNGQVGWNLGAACRALGLGISGAHAGRLFKRQFGIGVRDYAAGKRLIKAAHLLLTTSLCVKTISGDLGYKSTADFTRKFKHEFGVSPTGYRDQRFAR